MLKHPRTPSAANPSMDYPSGDSDHVSKRPRPVGLSEEVLAISLPQKSVTAIGFLQLVLDNTVMLCLINPRYIPDFNWVVFNR